MAHKVHVGQQFDDFSSLENAVDRYQNAECVKFFTRSSRNFEQAQRRMPDRTFNPNIKYSEVNYHCIHGGKNSREEGTEREKPGKFLSTSSLACMCVFLSVRSSSVCLSIHLDALVRWNKSVCLSAHTNTYNCMSAISLRCKIPYSDA